MRHLRTAARLMLGPAVLIAIAAGVRLYIADAFEVPSTSMEPSLETGDHMIVTRRFRAIPERGDVVVFHDAEGRHFVKRVVGLPGESIDAGGHVSVNGTTLAEPYSIPGLATTHTTQLVPAGHYFVMGDNRGISEDSRAFGVIPAESIVGRARLIYWSRGNSEEGIRWSRILTPIR